jgi:ArsR family transcriptional regulator, arsenate/arsenite/antimonite-responsive transcriptional repressor
MKGGIMAGSNKLTIPLDPYGGGTTNADDAELANLAKAIGHPARTAIVRFLLAGGECICGDIVDRLPLAQATVSQHLKVLKEAGWIKGEVDGPRVCYCARRETLERFITLVQGVRSGHERSGS